MARTAEETAKILSNLYEEIFGQDSYEPFRITWPQLRSLSDVQRLNDYYLKAISNALSDNERCLIPFNNFLLVVGEDDLSHYRMVPDRLIEQHLPEDEDIEVDEDDIHC